MSPQDFSKEVNQRRHSNMNIVSHCQLEFSGLLSHSEISSITVLQNAIEMFVEPIPLRYSLPHMVRAFHYF